MRLSSLPRLPLPRLPFPPSAPCVWAVDTERAQLCWGDLPAGPVTASAEGTTARIDHSGGPGAIELSDLRPGKHIGITLDHPAGSVRLACTTLARPPGERLSRVATISDLHLGSDHFGAGKQMFDPTDHAEPFALRSATAAIEAATTWGADHLVIKGDVAHHSQQAHFDLAGTLVDRFADLPISLLPGNHDVDGLGDHPDLPASVGQRNLPFLQGVTTTDLPGARIITADVTVERLGTGTISLVAHEIIDAVHAADQPCLLFLHQQFQTHRHSRYWPPGINGTEAIPFLDRLDRAARDAARPVLVSSGHTHRNRTRQHGTVTVTEVASTHHWPGVWAGYEIFEGGWTQCVRRIVRPDVLPWMEYSRNAVGSLWGRYAPGSLEDRCHTSFHA